MAYRINRAEQVQIEKHVEAIYEKHEAVLWAIGTLNERIENEFFKVMDAIEALDEAKDKAAGFLDDIHCEHTESYDLSTDKWQQSERGEAVREWLLEIKAQVSTLQESTSVAMPEPIDPDLLIDASEKLADLYMAPEEPNQKPGEPSLVGVSPFSGGVDRQ